MNEQGGMHGDVTDCLKSEHNYTYPLEKWNRPIKIIASDTNTNSTHVRLFTV